MEIAVKLKSVSLYVRSFSRSKIYSSLSIRHFAMSGQRLEKAIDDLKENPYYAKYASKIATLQETSPEEFLSRVEERKQHKQKSKEVTSMKGQFSSLLQPKKRITSLSEKNISENKCLDKIMKVELVVDKESEEIKKIWEQYHIQKEDVIAATVPLKDFEELTRKAILYPTFIFPLPRSQGYEFILCQFERNCVHFTPLLYYQVHKENAPECLTIIHYTELMDSKGIVLMRGQYDKNVLDAKEAQCLANQLQLYYSQNDPDKLKLLEIFTRTPDQFKHMDLIKQIETLKL